MIGWGEETNLSDLWWFGYRYGSYMVNLVYVWMIYGK